MKVEYNIQEFSQEEMDDGLHWDLLRCLLRFNQCSKEYINDIHISSDDCCIAIEWAQVPRSHEWGGHFEFLEENEVKMIEVIMPDNSIQYAFDKEEAEYILKEAIDADDKV